MAGGLARKYDGQREKKGFSEQMGISEGAGPGLKARVMDWESFFSIADLGFPKGPLSLRSPLLPLHSLCAEGVLFPMLATWDLADTLPINGRTLHTPERPRKGPMPKK